MNALSFRRASMCSSIAAWTASVTVLFSARAISSSVAARSSSAGRLTTTTVETVRFERPHRISFRLLRRPVPHVVETYALREVAGGTEFAFWEASPDAAQER